MAARGQEGERCAGSMWSQEARATQGGDKQERVNEDPPRRSLGNKQRDRGWVRRAESEVTALTSGGKCRAELRPAGDSPLHRSDN